MKIMYHKIDNDGRCSASIIYNEFINPFAPLTEKDFIGYNYNESFDEPEFNPEKPETIYIVDVSMDAVIYEFIKKCVDNGWKVIHIDHHASTTKFVNNLEDKTYLDKITSYYSSDESATMWTWCFCGMDEEDRLNPSACKIDFTENYDHALIESPNGTKKEIYVPIAVRYVNDQDVFRHQFEETRIFNAATFKIKDKNPWDQIWRDAVYNEKETLRNIMGDGETVLETFKQIQDIIRRNAFEYTFDFDGEKVTAICINSPWGNSDLFGELYNEYPMCVKYAYDGNIKKWRYTFYSNDETGYDCEKVASTMFNGGGHKHAAGGTTDECVF